LGEIYRPKCKVNDVKKVYGKNNFLTSSAKSTEISEKMLPNFNNFLPVPLYTIYNVNQNGTANSFKEKSGELDAEGSVENPSLS
jgi:hypothetical protein